MTQQNKFKMGSLFDGSGGFPLASVLCGIEPVWASEIEPFPIRVTRKRFPYMKHYGDISKIDVNDLEPVDLITGGSPCQDMSVAGKRQGMSKKCPQCTFTTVGNKDIDTCPECGAELEYTRSGLFMDQIRIVKEMREKDELEQLRSGRTAEYIRPRFMLWENVVGAFSSNGGEDFRAVLEETARIKDKTAVIPRPPKGKWQSSGCIVGDGYSIAWRVLDAQYWGVPQRRRRIALVADFGGQSAGEILFKRDGLQRNFTESRKTWQGIAGNLTESLGEAGSIILDDQGGSVINVGENIVPTLRAEAHGNHPCVIEPFCYNGENLTSPLNKQNPQPGDPCHTLGTDPRNYAMIPQQFSAGFCTEHSAQSRGIGYEEGKSPTLRAGVVPAAIKEQYSVDFGRTADRIQMNADKSVTLLGEGGGAGAKTGLYCLPKQKDLYCMATQQGGAEIMVDLAPTITAAAGMSGNNQPVINLPVYAFEPGIAKREGNEHRFVENLAPTLRATMGDNQVATAYSLQGNMIGREDHNGPQGSGVNEDVSFTLNATDRHAVSYCTDVGWLNSDEDISPTLLARTYKDPHLVTYETELEYIVRRLTPLECSRLQGFPDWWTDGLQIEKPNGHDIAFWRDVFETHREIVTGASKPKTDKQIIKWLQEEPNDGALYKMWGNGISLPCFLYVIEGIKEVLDREENH